MLLLLAGLQSIPTELEEAARIDGARRGQVFRYITLPLLRPTLALVLVFSVAGSLLAFDQFYIMTNGGPSNSTITAVYQIYRVSFVQFRLGYGAALSVLLMVVLACVSAVQLMLLRNTDHETDGTADEWRRRVAECRVPHAWPRGGTCVALAVLFLYPLYVMMSQSLKNPAEAAAGPADAVPARDLVRQLLRARERERAQRVRPHPQQRVVSSARPRDGGAQHARRVRVRAPALPRLATSCSSPRWRRS